MRQATLFLQFKKKKKAKRKKWERKMGVILNFSAQRSRYFVSFHAPFFLFLFFVLFSGTFRIIKSFSKEEKGHAYTLTGTNRITRCCL